MLLHAVPFLCPSDHSFSPTLSKGKTHWKQTWGLCLARHRITKRGHFTAWSSISAWKYLEGVCKAQATCRPWSGRLEPSSPDSGGTEEVRISATHLSLIPVKSERDENLSLKGCWGFQSCERTRPSGLSSPFAGSHGGSHDLPGLREAHQYVLFPLGAINLAKRSELATRLHRVLH